ALASMEDGLTGLDEIAIEGAAEQGKPAIIAALSKQTPDRIRVIAEAMRAGLTDAEIGTVTAWDPWFLARIREIVEAEHAIRASGLPGDEAGLRRLKMVGFTDGRLARLTGTPEAEIRRARHRAGVTPV